MAYKHRDIVIAWMDGAVIEQQLADGLWYALSPCTNKVQHAFCEDKCYRIKPKPVMIRHAAVSGPGGKVVVVYTKNYNKAEDKYSTESENDTDILWLDAWHEASFSAPEA